jgi:hypothetical protein
MGLVVGYESARNSDSGMLPVAPAHAVESGQNQAICGRTMAFVASIEWPHILGACCPECRRISAS